MHRSKQKLLHNARYTCALWVWNDAVAFTRKTHGKLSFQTENYFSVRSSFCDDDSVTNSSLIIRFEELKWTVIWNWRSSAHGGAIGPSGMIVNIKCGVESIAWNASVFNELLPIEMSWTKISTYVSAPNWLEWWLVQVVRLGKLRARTIPYIYLHAYIFCCFRFAFHICADWPFNRMIWEHHEWHFFCEHSANRQLSRMSNINDSHFYLFNSVASPPNILRWLYQFIGDGITVMAANVMLQTLKIQWIRSAFGGFGENENRPNGI